MFKYLPVLHCIKYFGADKQNDVVAADPNKDSVSFTIEGLVLVTINLRKSILMLIPFAD